jgi:hypothetical protein
MTWSRALCLAIWRALVLHQADVAAARSLAVLRRRNWRPGS